MKIRSKDFFTVVLITGGGLFLSAADCPLYIIGTFVAFMGLYLFIVVVAEAMVAELKKQNA